MTRGKYATRAAGRRDAQETAATIETYQRNVTKLAKERDDLKRELDEERLARIEERRQLHVLLNEGASPELLALRHEMERIRNEASTSRKLAEVALVKNDEFIRSACRYVSMTDGVNPGGALMKVLTWLTAADEPIQLRPDHLVTSLGVTPKGWVATILRTLAMHERHVPQAGTRHTGPRTRYVSLDRAEAEDFKEIHPNYKRHGRTWYPSVSYQGLELIDREVRRAN